MQASDRLNHSSNQIELHIYRAVQVSDYDEALQSEELPEFTDGHIVPEYSGITNDWSNV